MYVMYVSNAWNVCNVCYHTCASVQAQLPSITAVRPVPVPKIEQIKISSFIKYKYIIQFCLMLKLKIRTGSG